MFFTSEELSYQPFDWSYDFLRYWKIIFLSQLFKRWIRLYTEYPLFSAWLKALCTIWTTGAWAPGAWGTSFGASGLWTNVVNMAPTDVWFCSCIALFSPQNTSEKVKVFKWGVEGKEFCYLKNILLFVWAFLQWFNSLTTGRLVLQVAGCRLQVEIYCDCYMNS